MAERNIFNLFKILPIPKLIESDIVVMDKFPSFLAVSTDDSQYFTSEALACFSTTKAHVCKRQVTFNTSTDAECIANIFFHRNDSGCPYKKLTNKVVAQNILNIGLIIFSATDLQVFLTCENVTESVSIQGSFLIRAPSACSINSTLFSFGNIHLEVDTFLHDKIPIINCCSQFFSSHGISENNSSISLKSLSEVKDVGGEEIEFKWKKYSFIRFPDQLHVWHFSTVGLIIVSLALMILVIRYRINSRRTSGGTITVVCDNTQREPTITQQVDHNSISNVRSFRGFKL